ncbi:TetR/AcrR family transcriptional regulator [Rhodococcus sp. HNM0563]|uniref:TetR/AcrR family transcriptional regulator n=1 Tax=Rhodococcus sp. HNM0563 TaxID=2716339 RepID=UPI00146C738B|nr:TetR/AcrR family transcriptional regulator [Rhodococcus sp. HNM0563]NLU63145.1 TetR/AcrR family transcriptional regulator [Rhodococcus sp. HNM0563]
MTMSTGRLALLDAAERLVAHRGIHGVAAREVVKEAGQRNNSAIAYHFGSWHGLLDEIWSRHAPRMNTERAALLAAADLEDSPTLDRLVHAYIHPLAAQIARNQPSYWARFNEQWLSTAPLDVLSTPVSTGVQADYYPSDASLDVLSHLLIRIADRLDLPEPDARRRVSLMVRFVIGAFAAFERAQETGAAPDSASFEAEILQLANRMLDLPQP